MGGKGSKVAAEGEKIGPVMVAHSDRKCRDIIWLILFGAYLAGMVMVFILGVQNGDAARLLYPIDTQGNQCGGKDTVCYNGEQCGKRAVYPRVNEDIRIAMENGVDITDPTQLLEIPFYSLCLNSCPEGHSDIDGDGQIRDWVCEYAIMDYFSETPRYAAAPGEVWENKEIPTLAAKADLEYCLAERGNGVFGAMMLSDSQGPENVKCKTLLGGCFKMYVPERDLFFRCVPQTEANTTCSASPYLLEKGESVQTKIDSDGNVVARPASDEHCGVCLDPEKDDDGKYMDPGSKECKAKIVHSMSSVTKTTPNPIFEQVNTWTELLVRWMGDVELTSVYILLSGAVGAMAIGVLWLVLLRFFSGIFVWVVVWSLFIALTFLTVQFLVYGAVIDTEAITDVMSVFTESTSNNTAAAESIISSMDVFGEEQAATEEIYRILGFVMLALTAMYLLFILTLHRKIRLAVQILKEATKVIAVIPSLLFFPLVTAAISVGAGVYWVYGAMLISSSGEIESIAVAGVNITTRRVLSNDTAVSQVGDVIMKEFESSDLNTWLWIYHFFGYLWLNQLIQAVSACAIAGAVASHYWASEVESEKASKMPSAPLLASLKRVFRFHLGSLAFGSFIIAVIQLIQFALAYLDKQTQGLQKKNKIVKIVMKLVQCCLWCFKKIMQFVTKHAYIQIALRGTSFCVATKDAFYVMLTNLPMIGVATVINNLVNLFAKLVITAGSGCLCWILVTQLPEEDEAPSSELVPVFVAVIMAWFVGGLFMSVYGLAVDTILICYCEDSARNDGSLSKPYYMSKGLQRVANKSNKMYKAQAVEKSAGNDDDDDDINSVGGGASPAGSKKATPSQKELL